MLPTDRFMVWAGIFFNQMGIGVDERPVLELVGVPSEEYTGSGFYACMGGDCGCFFWLSDEGDVIWVDRWVPHHGCANEECACHLIPHLNDEQLEALWTPPVVSTVVWEGQVTWDSWWP